MHTGDFFKVIGFKWNILDFFVNSHKEWTNEFIQFGCSTVYIHNSFNTKKQDTADVSIVLIIYTWINEIDENRSSRISYKKAKMICIYFPASILLKHAIEKTGFRIIWILIEYSKLTNQLRCHSYYFHIQSKSINF